MNEPAKPTNFIRHIIDQDLAADPDKAVITRFPPEPNGYLHIGHAKSICLNFGLADDYAGRCHLRFDDTNPEKESVEYTDAIQEDVRWLGYSWANHLYFASDNFEQLYAWAMELIDSGKAYVDSQTAEEIRATRGTLTEPGQNSPYRERASAESRDLFERMRAGEFADGAHVVRAKIDMASGNMNLRDPVIYRIRHAHHHRTGDAWCIYPNYDFAHGQCDAIEGVTYSLCTLEFADHKPLYDWLLDNISAAPCHPRQYEFSRLNLDYTIMSKRLLNALVEEKQVNGWDDPRMPTIAGMRRRGYPAAAIRDFCERIGVTRQDNRIELSLLENCVREALDPVAPRAMAVLNPLKVVITNYPEDQVESFTAQAHPKNPEMGSRKLPFSRELVIEHDDFMLDPPKKFFRLGPGREVKLRFGYIIKCNDVITDDKGNVVELHCTYDPDSLGGGRKVKGIIHWLCVPHAVRAEVRVYDRLFNVADPGKTDFHRDLNPDSLVVIEQAWLEPGLANAAAGESYQFERLGYFQVDSVDAKPGAPVFNRSVTLRDTWAKAMAKNAQKG